MLCRLCMTSAVWQLTHVEVGTYLLDCLTIALDAVCESAGCPLAATSSHASR